MQCVLVFFGLQKKCESQLCGMARMYLDDGHLVGSPMQLHSSIGTLIREAGTALYFSKRFLGVKVRWVGHEERVKGFKQRKGFLSQSK